MDARRLALALLTVAAAAISFPRAAAWGGPQVVVVPQQIVGGVGFPVAATASVATSGAVPGGGGVVVNTPVTVQTPVTQNNVQIARGGGGLGGGLFGRR